MITDHGVFSVYVPDRPPAPQPVMPALRMQSLVVTQGVGKSRTQVRVDVPMQDPPVLPPDPLDPAIRNAPENAVFFRNEAGVDWYVMQRGLSPASTKITVDPNTGRAAHVDTDASLIVPMNMRLLESDEPIERSAIVGKRYDPETKTFA